MNRSFFKTSSIFLFFFLFFFALGPTKIKAFGGFVTEQFVLPIHYCNAGESGCDWWSIVDRANLQYFGAPCDPNNVSCVTRLIQSGKRFARLSIDHDPALSGYNNVEFSELQTGVSYHKGLERWSPTVGHPVFFTETMRFGPNYNQNGSGGAIGSAGGGLWNSYLDGFPNNPTFHPITALWWGWGEQGTAFGFNDSLSVSVFNENEIVYFTKIAQPLDMQDWMTWIMKWTALPNGNHEVKFSVIQNGNLYVVGDTHDFYPDGISPLSPLSATNWNDNQFVENFDEFGNPVVVFHNPEPGVTDYWDLNGMTISQP